MFGEVYFEARRRLGELVLQISALAEKTSADRGKLENEAIVQGLTQPFLLVACGEVNAGKSTFLNGLFGEEICPANVLPETDRVHWYQYGEKQLDEKVTELQTDCFRPLSFLKDFSLVDTPATNSQAKEQQRVIGSFLEESDLIFWVFPADSPWGAATWDYISKQSEDIVEKSVFILQKADLHEGKDIDVVLGHVRDLSEKRLGKAVPVYPVSGVLALQARQGESLDVNTWCRSGGDALDRLISGAVVGSGVRKKMLTNVKDALNDVLENIEEMIELRARSLEDNEGFLRSIEEEVGMERDRQSSDFIVKLAGMRHVFASQADKGLALMKRKMNLWSSFRSLFMPENLPKEIEATMMAAVEVEVAEKSREEGQHLVAACKVHWETVQPRVKERLTVELENFKEERFTIMHERFVKRMSEAAKKAVSYLNIRGGLDDELAKRRKHLKSWLTVVLVFLLAAGVTGSLQLTPYPYLSLGLLAVAVSSMVAFVFRAKATRGEMITVFAEKLNDAQVPFADALNSDYQEGIYDYYMEYGSLLESVRRHIVQAKAELQPNHEQWHGLFLKLKEMEQSL